MLESNHVENTQYFMKLSAIFSSSINDHVICRTFFCCTDPERDECLLSIFDSNSLHMNKFRDLLAQQYDGK